MASPKFVPLNSVNSSGVHQHGSPYVSDKTIKQRYKRKKQKTKNKMHIQYDTK